MQMRAISKPASTLPRASTPASTIVVPAPVRWIATAKRAASSTRRLTRRSASALTLRCREGSARLR